MFGICHQQILSRWHYSAGCDYWQRLLIGIAQKHPGHARGFEEIELNANGTIHNATCHDL